MSTIHIPGVDSRTCANVQPSLDRIQGDVTALRADVNSLMSATTNNNINDVKDQLKEMKADIASLNQDQAEVIKLVGRLQSDVQAIANKVTVLQPLTGTSLKYLLL